MRKEWLNKKYRHVYRYVCSVCGFKRLTLSHDRLVLGICTNCEATTPDKDQGALFPKND